MVVVAESDFLEAGLGVAGRDIERQTGMVQWRGSWPKLEQKH